MEKQILIFFFISATNFESNQVETTVGGDWSDTWLHETPRRHAKLEQEQYNSTTWLSGEAIRSDFQIIVIDNRVSEVFQQCLLCLSVYPRYIF